MANLSQLPVLAAPSVILCPLPELMQGGFLVELLRCPNQHVCIGAFPVWAQQYSPVTDPCMNF